MQGLEGKEAWECAQELHGPYTGLGRGIHEGTCRLQTQAMAVRYSMSWTATIAFPSCWSECCSMVSVNVRVQVGGVDVVSISDFKVAMSPRDADPVATLSYV